MASKVFRARIDEYEAFNAYPNGGPPTPHPIPVTGDNVEGWQVDSQAQTFNYKIIHNLNLSHPEKLVVQLKSVYTFASLDPVYARVFPGTRNYFVIQGYGKRPGGTGPQAEFEHSCGFVFEAELFD